MIHVYGESYNTEDKEIISNSRKSPKLLFGYLEPSSESVNTWTYIMNYSSLTKIVYLNYYQIFDKQRKTKKMRPR